MSLSKEIQADLDRAETSLQAAQILLEASFYDDAASRTYYAAFHAACALLLSEELSFNSHSGVLRAIGLYFVKSGKLDRRFGRDLNWLAELRHVSDYGELRNVSETESNRALEVATAFLAEVSSLLSK